MTDPRELAQALDAACCAEAELGRPTARPGDALRVRGGVLALRRRFLRILDNLPEAATVRDLREAADGLDDLTNESD